MLTYTTQTCLYCHGTGKVRVLIVFKRQCPLCGGTGEIKVPHITHDKISQPFTVSELTPETRGVLKANSTLLTCLSPTNRAELLRKYSDLRPRAKRQTGARMTEQERHQQIEAMGAGAMQQRQFADFMRHSQEQHQRFVQWSQQQHQQHMQWANQQFQNFVNQNRR